MKRTAKGLAVIVVLFFALYSCTHSPYVMPETLRTYDPNICFERDILPIFVSNCAKSGCHDAQRHASGYELDSYDNIVKKGIIPGNSAASKIWESVTIGKGEGGIMPQHAPRLTTTQLDLLKRWIAAGAVNGGACTATCDTENFTYSGAIKPMMESYCVGCHNTSTSLGGALNDYNSVKTASVSGNLIANITHKAGYNPMPPTSLQMSDCQVTQIKKWVAAGAPNN